MEKENKLALYGAIIGDYFGSHYEGVVKNKYDDMGKIFIYSDCEYTDDTKMTCAVASAINMANGNLNGFFARRKLKENAIREMKRIGRKYQGRFGGSFYEWLMSNSKKPYHSYGNGACMKLGPVGLVSNSRKEAIKLSDLITGITHDHPISMYFARVVSSLIFEAKGTDSKDDMEKTIAEVGGYALLNIVKAFDLEDLHENYGFDITCEGSVPQALYCFLTSTSFGDCLSRCLYVGGDADTIAAIACSIAAPFYGDEQVRQFVCALPEMPNDLSEIIEVFSKKHLW